ncbi:MAG: hypothetical protein RJA38_1379, partial [Bacteroidota bacterium]
YERRYVAQARRMRRVDLVVRMT